MLDIYARFRDFHVFKKFKQLLGDCWNVEIFVIVKNDKKFFYDNIGQLNNSVVKSLLKSSLFKNYFLGSINNVMKGKIDSKKTLTFVPWKQTGLDLFIVPLPCKNTSSQAFLVATGFAPKKEEQLYQSLLYLGLSKIVIQEQMKELKLFSPSNEVYIKEMLNILSEEFLDLLQQKQKQEHTLDKLNQKNQIQKHGNIIGKSPAMDYIFNTLEKIKKYDASVLIEGENGTGKKLLAKTIHEQSLRSKKKFHVQNFSVFKGKLLELEIFGCNSNSVPKMHKAQKPLLEKLNGGTLFLNEIENASLEFQNKLLTFVKESVFFSEGDSKQKKSNVRILVATSKNLKTLVKEGKFNEELYRAISVIQIKTPSLKYKKEDIPLLAEYFLNKKPQLEKREISSQAIKALSNYSWPGNVRELESEIKKILSLIPKTQQMITEEDLSPHIRNSSSSLNTVFQPGKQKLKETLRSIEKQILLDCLRRNNWNKTRVAKSLGISRTFVVLKTKEYGIIKKEGA